MYTLLFSTVLVCFLSLTDIRAQIFWEHKTYDAWINPDTQESDSTLAFTAISNYGRNITAAALLFRDNGSSFARVTFYRSNDDGVTWFEQPPAVPDEPFILNWGITKIQQIDSLHVVAIGDQGTVYMTSDAGATWYRRDAPVRRELRDIHFANPMEGILLGVGANNSSDSSLFTTTDGGVNWINQHHLEHTMSSCYSYGSGKYRLFDYWRGPIYKTNDNFATLDTSALLIDSLVDPSPRYVFSQCNFDAGDTLFATGSYWPDKDTLDAFGSFAAIMRSVDGGKTWEKPWVFKTDTLARIKHLTSTRRDTIFAGGGDLSHYLMSTDKGATWRADSLMLDTTYDWWNKCFGMVMSQDGHPIAIYGPGPWPIYSLIWRGSYAKSSVELAETIQYYTKLYPNPTSGEVTIQSIGSLKSPIKVVDMLGRKVRDGRLSEDGKAKFDLSELPRGIYYVVLDYNGREYMISKVALTFE
jgi:photosystem II stability/assembly factor-like uncharacterized protein